MFIFGMYRRILIGRSAILYFIFYNDQDNNHVAVWLLIFVLINLNMEYFF